MVERDFVKEWMSQDLIKADPICWFIHQHISDQLKQVLVILLVALLVILDCLAVFPHVLAGAGMFVPQEATSLEVFSLCPPHHGLGERPEDLLHHGEVLPVVVGLEQREPEVELEGDAANAPNVAGLTPAKLQDHFGSPVVSGADHLAVVLPVEGGAAEVNEPHLGVLHLPDVLPLSCIVRDLPVR